MKKKKPKIKIITNIKIYYLDIFKDLNLAKFRVLIYILKVSNKNYRKKIIAKYDCILRVGIL